MTKIEIEVVELIIHETSSADDTFIIFL